MTASPPVENGLYSLHEHTLKFLYTFFNYYVRNAYQEEQLVFECSENGLFYGENGFPHRKWRLNPVSGAF